MSPEETTRRQQLKTMYEDSGYLTADQRKRLHSVLLQCQDALKTPDEVKLLIQMAFLFIVQQKDAAENCGGVDLVEAEEYDTLEALSKALVTNSVDPLRAMFGDLGED